FLAFRSFTMSIYEEMKADLKELVKLVRQAEQYNAAVGYGALRADEDTNRLHLQLPLDSRLI
ncbi:hypothetical protein, partial [Azotobacter beijerinckii]|uniref:hypothetical protein n=1 Tax=Azotobacter beijerinckii TaxID=170623 RepID=UPI002954C565